MLNRDDSIAQAIRQRNLEVIMSLMFNPSEPILQTGFKTETELWDYKKDCPKNNPEHWADISKTVLAFHNKRGGILIFGISDNFSFIGAKNSFDSKKFNDQIRKYLSDRIWVEFHREFVQKDQSYLGIAIIPPRGPELELFTNDSPKTNKQAFKKGESAIREGDSTKILSKAEILEIAKSFHSFQVNKIYEVDEPNYRIFNQDSNFFIERKEFGEKIIDSVIDTRTSVTSLIGFGGTGKTALATWATKELYKAKSFKFIVSITAKDRELTASGIKGLKPELTSFETLLDNILEVIGFADQKGLKIDDKQTLVKDLIKGSEVLLFVDNLETVDDARIIEFLDDLPVGVKAITTSRRTKVRVSSRPITIGALTEPEVIKLIRATANESGYGYVNDFSDAECIRVGTACDNFPLGIKWILSKSKSTIEALSAAEEITQSGKRGEELLEFCFRRVFDSLLDYEKSVLHVLSLFQSQSALEAIMIATELPQYILDDILENLVEDALVQRTFDSQLNTYTYSLLPVTRAFVLTQVYKKTGLADKYQKRLSDYYEAKDIPDGEQRKVLRELRQGKEGSEIRLVEFAQGEEKRGDFASARGLYQEAITRNPKSSIAYRAFAEFCRHKDYNKTLALDLYEKAARYAPYRGEERAKIYREWGMLLRESGLPNATDLAIEKFQEALKFTPNDPITIHALAKMFERQGNLKLVIDLLEPLAEHENEKTRDITLPMLLEAYEKTGEILRAAQIKNKID